MIKRFYILSGLVVLIGLFFLILNVTQKSNQHKQIKIYDNIHKILASTIDIEKNALLSLTIASSKSRAIQDVLLNNNRLLGHNVLHANTQMLKIHTDKKNIYMQIITKKLLIFARSWEENISNIPFATGRKNSLTILLKNHNPQTGPDIGLPFGIRASSVISYKNSTLGILEAITPYDNIVSKMRLYQVETIPLLYKNFVPLRYIDEKNLPTFNHDYLIANDNTNHYIIDKLYELSKNDLAELMNNDFLFKESYLYLSYPILSIDNIKLGNFIAVIKKDDFERFLGKQKSIIQSIYTLDSSRDDIYHYAKQNEVLLFADMQKEYITNLKYSVENKDLIDFEDTAYRKLKEMDKEELIDLILYRHSSKKLRGDIK